MAKIIKSTGPSPCPVMIVAERPGKEEASRGYVLCGPSGKELDRFLLTESGLDRASVHCRNLVTDYRDGENPEPWEVERDWNLTVEAIMSVRPKFVMAMGLWSARAFLGPAIDMEWASGRHFPLSWNCGSFTVMPVTHTAATLHQPRYAARCADDFRNFGRLVKGLPLPTGHLSKPMPVTYSDGVLTLEEVVAMDTEGTVERPWGLSYSCRPGVASVQHGYRRHRKWDCDRLDKALVVMHGALHDLPVLAKLGVRPRQFTCTLLMAALLGTEPHGLKPLARRWCGMVMSEYDDVVRGARREKALEYLGGVLDWVGDELLQRE